jgi:hypothetical protein
MIDLIMRFWAWCRSSIKKSTKKKGPDMQTLDEAFDIILQKKLNSGLDKTKVVDFTRKVLEWIPDQVKNSDSFSIGSRGNEKYISINIMNYLIFRIPGYQDKGKKGDFDMIFLSTRAKRKKLYGSLSQKPKERHWGFDQVACDNIYLWLDEVEMIKKEHIDDFKDACLMLLNAPRRRSQETNIRI